MFFKVVHEGGRSCIGAAAHHAVRMTNACIERTALSVHCSAPVVLSRFGSASGVNATVGDFPAHSR